MERRDFLTVGAAGVVAGAAAMSMATPASAKSAPRADGKFKLRYAPGFTQFSAHAGKDPIDNIKYCNDMGFRAMFDNGITGKPKDVQDKIAKEMERRDMTLGPFVLRGGKDFVLRSKEIKDQLIATMKKGVEAAKRVNARWALVVPGSYDAKLHWDYQTANVIDNLRYCADVLEKSDLTMVLEPLNAHVNHPGLFLTGIPQSYLICRGVNSPSIKIVDDIYHQQITEGNLINNIKMAWDEIGAFHLGDSPGRKEPGTGEINYRNIFKYIHSRKYEGTLCMEHGKSKKGKEGEVALLEAYRSADDF